MALILIGGCSPKKSGAPKARAPVPVLAEIAQARDFPVEVQAVGNVQAYSSVSVRSQITGRLFKVHFVEGDDVKAGDLLFTIDPRPSESTLRQIEATTQRDEAQLESARLDFNRVKRLMESGISSSDEFDKAQASFRSLEATVLADHAAVSNAVLNLEYTKIHAPIDGRTGSLAVKEGNLIKAEDDRLVTLNQLRPIYVAFAVPEQELPSVRRRFHQSALPVFVSFPGATNVAATGELTFIDNNIDATTGTILLKGTFTNEDQQLWPGQFVQVRLTVDTLAGATVVPSQAVQSSQTGEFVFVVKSDKAVEKRSVAPGILRGGWTVIEKGVKPGEMVVTDGQMRLGQNSVVTIQTGLLSSDKANASAEQGRGM